MRKVFWGLLLIFFNVNVNHINLFTTLLGGILLFTALWQLKERNWIFKEAYFSSLLLLLIQLGGILIYCTPYADNPTASIVFAVVGTLNMLFLIFRLFGGLSILSAELGKPELKPRLNTCAGLYLPTAAFTCIGLLVPPIVLPVLLILVIIFIYILATIGRVSSIADSASFPIGRALNLRYFTLLGCYLITGVISFFGLLCALNFSPTHTYFYQKGKGDGEVAQIKSSMKAKGFTQAVLNDLTEDEVLRYKDLKSVSYYTRSIQSDGGELELNSYASCLKNGKIRLLASYNWVKAPRHRFNDMIGLTFDQRMINPILDGQSGGSALYDDKIAGQTMTFKTDWLDQQTTETLDFPKYKMRLEGGNAENLRGYIACNGYIVGPEEKATTEVIITYCHQHGFINFGNQDTFKLYQSGSVSMYEENPPYSEYALDALAEYNP